MQMYTVRNGHGLTNMVTRLFAHLQFMSRVNTEWRKSNDPLLDTVIKLRTF
jgi:hypothetical protein